MLNRLISKILVGEVKKIDGQKVQEVRIVYNFVGEISEMTACNRQISRRMDTHGIIVVERFATFHYY